MTAREKFQRGQRVRLSDEGRARTGARREFVATVVGYGREDHLVTIIRDGLKTRECYHMKFLEPAREPAADPHTAAQE